MASFYTFWVKSDKLAVATVPGFATLLSHGVVDEKKIQGKLIIWQWDGNGKYLQSVNTLLSAKVGGVVGGGHTPKVF